MKYLLMSIMCPSLCFLSSPFLGLADAVQFTIIFSCFAVLFGFTADNITSHRVFCELLHAYCVLVPTTAAMYFWVLVDWRGYFAMRPNGLSMDKFSVPTYSIIDLNTGEYLVASNAYGIIRTT